MDDIKRIAQSTLQEAGVHSITIKNKLYTIELLPATQAFAVATQLLKVCLPAIGAFGDGVRNKELIMPEDDTMYTQMSVLLVRQMNDISVMDVLTLLGQGITCNGTTVILDDEFKGNLGGMVMLLEFILRENCGSFFTDYLQAKGIDLPSLKEKFLKMQEQTTTQSEEQ